MAKAKVITALALTTVMLVVMTGLAAADKYDVYDGNLSDWGVTPFTDWVPDAPTARYVEENYNGTNPEPNGHPLGGEYWDIEALYFDADDPGTNAYFAIVTSYPYTGDLAIDIDGDPGNGWEYGINTRKGSTNFGKVYHNPVWHKPIVDPNAAPGFIVGGDVVGTCDVIQTMIDGDPEFTPDGHYNPNFNFIIEGKIPRSMLGNPTEGQLSNIHITIWCGNDEIIIGKFKWTEVPEFATIAIPVAAILGLLFFYSHRKRKEE